MEPNKWETNVFFKHNLDQVVSQPGGREIKLQYNIFTNIMTRLLSRFLTEAVTNLMEALLLSDVGINKNGFTFIQIASYKHVSS